MLEDLLPVTRKSRTSFPLILLTRDSFRNQNLPKPTQRFSRTTLIHTLRFNQSAKVEECSRINNPQKNKIFFTTDLQPLFTLQHKSDWNEKKIIYFRFKFQPTPINLSIWIIGRNEKKNVKRAIFSAILIVSFPNVSSIFVRDNGV